MKKLKKGFTLIELLVVIAIIGLLSAVVMSSLSSARSRGNDSAVQSNMNNIITQSLMAVNPNTVSSGSCTPANFTSDTVIQKQISAVSASSMSKVAYCVSNGSGLWAVSAPLNSPKTSGRYWCVDSDGFRGEVDPGANNGFNVTSTSTACNK